MKYQIGEKVTVREDLENANLGFNNLWTGMLHFAGKEVTITGALKTPYGDRYEVEGYPRRFSEDCFIDKAGGTADKSICKPLAEYTNRELSAELIRRFEE